MKNITNFILSISVLIFSSGSIMACLGPQVSTDYDLPDGLCGTTEINILTEYVNYDDYCRYTLEEYINGQWVVSQTFTTGLAQNAGTPRNTCYDLDHTFYEGVDYTGEHIFRVRSEVFHQTGTTATQVDDQYGNIIEPENHKPIELDAITVLDEHNASVSTLSQCLAGSYTLEVDHAISHNWALNGFFIRAYDLGSGQLISELDEGPAYDLGGMGTYGTNFPEWLISDVQDWFGDFVGSNVGEFKIELSVKNEYCEGSSPKAETEIVINAQPYIADFEFRYNADSDPFTGDPGPPVSPNKEFIVPASQDVNNPACFGAITGELVSRVESGTSANLGYYDYFTIRIERYDLEIFSWVKIAELQNEPVPNGAAFAVEVSSIPLAGNGNNGDRPINNFNETYKIFLTVFTDGCAADTKMSYFCVNSYKNGQLRKVDTEFWHETTASDGNFNLHCPANNNIEYYIYNIFSLNGALLKSGRTGSGTESIEFDSESKGLYMIEIRDQEENFKYSGKIKI